MGDGRPNFSKIHSTFIIDGLANQQFIGRMVTGDLTLGPASNF